MNFVVSVFNMMSMCSHDEENKSEPKDKLGSLEQQQQQQQQVQSIDSPKVQVFLRIRPLRQEAGADGADEAGDTCIVEDACTLVLKYFAFTETSRRSKFTKVADCVVKKRYKFSHILNADASQAEAFDRCVRPAVLDLLAEHRSSTVIGYGTSDSGKSYTMFGSRTEPGLVPRSIQLVFSALACSPAPSHRPTRFDSVERLDEGDRALDAEAKDKLLASRLPQRALLEEAYAKLQEARDHEHGRPLDDALYSVWVSFVEIYNDGIYDLLATDEEDRNAQLKLAIDKRGVAYVQGMRSLCASSGLEAYKLMVAGQSRLSTAPAGHYRSSRSHSVFTLKLLKHAEDSSACDVQVLFF